MWSSIHRAAGNAVEESGDQPAYFVTLRTAFFSDSALSVRSQVKSESGLPKWPYADVAANTGFLRSRARIMPPGVKSNISSSVITPVPNVFT